MSESPWAPITLAEMEAMQRVAPPPTASYSAAKKHKMF